MEKVIIFESDYCQFLSHIVNFHRQWGSIYVLVNVITMNTAFFLPLYEHALQLDVAAHLEGSSVSPKLLLTWQDRFFPVSL